jgi:hypothetical protein
MAVSDDLNRLAAQDVVYFLRYTYGGGPPSAREVFRGRLRQSLTSQWVFNASTGQNGVVGFILGGVGPTWSSSESPSSGIQVTINNAILSGNPALIEQIVLTSLIPVEFTE